jgi:hypothetical protein
MPPRRIGVTPHIGTMNLELTDEQADALDRELRRIIDDDRYPLSPRIQILREIRNMIRPEPKREPLLRAEISRAAEQGQASNRRC